MPIQFSKDQIEILEAHNAQVRFVSRNHKQVVEIVDKNTNVASVTVENEDALSGVAEACEQLRTHKKPMSPSEMVVRMKRLEEENAALRDGKPVPKEPEPAPVTEAPVLSKRGTRLDGIEKPTPKARLAPLPTLS